MKEDKRRILFMIYLTLFTFCMNLLTVAQNYIAFFIGWEGVGLTSFLLIGFWFEDKENIRKAKQAFMLTKLADIGYIIGAGYLTYYNINFMEKGGISDYDRSILYGDIPLPIKFLMFLPCIGKSALFPLFVWLPNAMVAPTPVSAHLHSATMVAAGVFYLTKFYLFFEELFKFSLSNIMPEVFTSHLNPLIILIIIGFFLCSLCATLASDIKRLLAFSTISHLSLMYAGFFIDGLVPIYGNVPFCHLILHAFTKAPLFLIAGVLMHLYHTQDIYKLRGVFHKNNIFKAILFILVLSLAGFPFVGTFWSKSLILWRLENTVHSELLSAAITVVSALYCARLYFLLTAKPSSTEQEMSQDIKGEKIPFISISILCLFLVLSSLFLLGQFFFKVVSNPPMKLPTITEISSSLITETVIIVSTFILTYLFLNPLEKIIKIIPKATQYVELERAYYFVFQLPIQFIQFLSRTTIEELWDEFVNKFISSDFVKFIYGFYKFFYNGVIYNYLIIILLSMVVFFFILAGYGIP